MAMKLPKDKFASKVTKPTFVTPLAVMGKCEGDSDTKYKSVVTFVPILLQYISPFYTKQELVSWIKREDTDVRPFHILHLSIV